ncbi:MAG: glycosyltransferase family 2 protein [Akkermansia muciniphila]|nr:glycosyltransferase family 2 protein [Akkermansia muciniphila]
MSKISQHSQPGIPDISVIIPMYNSENDISFCLAKLRQQELSNLEIICVDDGSTDHTAEKVLDVARVDSRIRLFRQKNAGPGAARNLGIAHAHGHYIAFLDADDEYPSNETLKELYDKAVQSKFSIVGGSIIVRQADGRLDDTFDGEFDGQQFHTSGPMQYSDYQYDFGFYRFIYSRELIQKNNTRFPTLRYFEDPVFMVNAFWCAGFFYAIDKPTYLYNFTHHNVNRKTKANQVIDIFRGIGYNLRFSKENNLPRLHWYTISRFNMFYNQAVRNGRCYTFRVELAIRAACRHMSLTLACRWKPIDVPFYSGLTRLLIHLKHAFNP